MNQELVKRFNKEFPLFFEHNKKDRILARDLTSDDRYQIRENFHLKGNEEILYLCDTSFWNNKNQGTVITDLGIHIIIDNDYPDLYHFLSWNQITKVRYRGELFLFITDDNDDIFSIHECNLPGGHVRLAKYLSSLAEMVEPEIDEGYQIVDKIIDLMNNEALDEAIELGLQYKNSFPISCLVIECYIQQQEYDQAIFLATSQLQQYINEDDEDYLIPIRGHMLAYIGYCEMQLENYDEALSRFKTCISLLEINDELKKVPLRFTELNYEHFVHQSLGLAEEGYSKGFLELPYNERKILCPTSTYTEEEPESFKVLSISNTNMLDFPIGHPIANQLYVGHPWIPTKYIPFDEYELAFLEDKVREYCEVMQALGATEINVDCLNSQIKDNNQHDNQKTELSGNKKVVSASGSYEKAQNNKIFDELNHTMNLHQRFKPTSAPQLPKKLVWYPHEPSWQRIFKQRMQGSLLEHEERIETKKSRVVNEDSLTEIQGEFKVLLSSLQGDHKRKYEGELSMSDNATLVINVKFAPLDQLQSSNPSKETKKSISSQSTESTSNLTDSEKKYYDLVQRCYDNDGSIDEKDKEFLERRRTKLNISEERAQEIENMLVPQLTEEEHEYLEDVKAYKKDGEITSKERGLLEMLRDSNDITPERALELENMVK